MITEDEVRKTLLEAQSGSVGKLSPEVLAELCQGWLAHFRAKREANMHKHEIGKLLGRIRDYRCPKCDTKKKR